MQHTTLQANGIDIHCVEAGSGPLVVLLHGFPEFWYAWRRQIPALAAAGLRAVAPDLRGYNRSERPRGVAAYRIEALVGDVVALVEGLGEKEAVLVGQDWGGIIGWYTAMHHPFVVRRLVILNAPHPVAYARELRRLSSQLWRSWYAGLYQLPWIPEALWRARNFALLRRIVRSGAARTEEEIERYVEALSRPGSADGRDPLLPGSAVVPSPRTAAD